VECAFARGAICVIGGQWRHGIGAFRGDRPFDAQSRQLRPQQPRASRPMRLALLHPVLGKRPIVEQVVRAQLRQHSFNLRLVNAGASQAPTDLVFTSGPLR
jgi:hypothetical protein